VIVERRTEEDDPIVQQSRVEVKRALTPRRLLDDQSARGD
jgi:hypothetical protein